MGGGLHISVTVCKISPEPISYAMFVFCGGKSATVTEVTDKLDLLNRGVNREGRGGAINIELPCARMQAFTYTTVLAKIAPAWRVAEWYFFFGCRVENQSH